ncbi:MAG: hypothetical protein ABJO09_00900 [Hyphomicrobiales bacterium]
MSDQSMETEIAVIHTELVAMREESRASRAEMKKEMDQIKGDVSAMKQQSARWKGGIAVLAGVGAFAVMGITLFEKLASAFRG